MFILLIISSFSFDQNAFNNLSIYQLKINQINQSNESSTVYKYGPTSFNGTLSEVEEGNILDYVKDLGFNAILLSSIYSKYSVDPIYGTDKNLKNITEKAHSLGLYVFLEHQLITYDFFPKDINGMSMQKNMNNLFTILKWIEKFDIDGFRIISNGSVISIKNNVFELCERRRILGKKWGILGYLFGDENEKFDDINKETCKENSGLQSVFDKQSRLDLVQGIAEDENGVSFPYIEKISRIHRTAEEKGFCLNVYPNLYISDQTTKRLGNLIYDKYNEDQNSDSYWARYKISIAALSIFTGPITLYYGDEIGFSTNQSSITKDSLIQRQKDLHQFTQKILNARLNHPAMYSGIYNKSFPLNNVYINYKLDVESNDRIVCISSFNTQQITVEYKLECSELVDIITGEIINGINGTFSISIPAFGVRIFTANETNITDAYVDEKSENAVIKAENKKIAFEKNAPISSNDAKKTSILVSVIGSLCIVLIIALVIGIAVYTLAAKKKNEKLEEYDNEPLLLDENNGYTNV